MNESKSLFMRAVELARLAHHGQVDKAGVDYFEHLNRVANRVLWRGGDRKAVAVAWLHDVIEDTPVDRTMLLRFGFPADWVESIDIVTHRKGEPYEEYVARIRDSGDEAAILVKTADLDDHFEMMCPEAESLLPRYRRAYKILTGKERKE